MAFEHEKHKAQNILSGIEDGRLSAYDTFRLIEDADPALIHFIFSWLRAWYPPSHPAAEVVLTRLGELVTQYPRAAKIAKEGQDDMIVEWFEDAYNYRDYRAAEFIDMVVEKLEG